VIWAAYAMTGAFTLQINLIGPLLPHVRAELDLGYAEAALHMSAFAAGMMATGIVGERVTGAFGRRRAMWAGLAGMAVGLTLLGFAPMLWVGILGCAIMGAFGTVALVVAPALLAETDPETRSLAFAEQNILAFIGALVSPLALWLVIELLGWRGAPVIGWLGLAAMLYFFRRIRIPEAPKPRGDADGRLTRAYWAYWTLLMVTVAMEFSVAVWGPSYLETVLGLSRGSATLAVAAFPMGMVTGRIAGLALLHRFRPHELVLPSIALGFAGFMLFWQGGHAWTGLAGLFFTGLGLANLYPLGITLAVAAAGSATSIATARTSLGSGLAIICAPLALGAMADRFGIVLAYAIVPVLLAVSVAAFAAGRRTLKLPPAAR
jgi:fucose permease